MTAQTAPTALSAGPCRFCGAPLTETVVDLGTMPSANYYLRADEIGQAEPAHPLRAYVCHACCLVQLPAFHSPEELFGDYAYFSSYSDSWVRRAEIYCRQMIDRFHLEDTNRVIEVASNDGYLLQAFKSRGIPVLGIEPAANVAKVAQDKGIETLVRFFGVDLATELARADRHADLLVANNVLAHVPDLNGFVAGLATLLAPAGVLTVEFPHLLRLLEERQFDTIYHEHFSYFSLLTAERIFARHGLVIFDVDELPTHGGSLRVYASRSNIPRLITERVIRLKARERDAELNRPETYRRFGAAAEEARRQIREFFVEARRDGKTVAGYGAPAKGNTLLNYCGIGTDALPYTVDRNPHKQGRFLPGSHIPVHHPDKIRETCPDYVLILPWNLKDEITRNMAYVREWGGRFVVPIPRMQVIE